MKDFHIFRIRSYRKILSIVTGFADDLFNQAHNNRELLSQLAKKYSLIAEFYLVEIDGKEAGFIAFYANDTATNTGFISMIVVHSPFQGLGIGSILMDLAISVCKLRGLTRLRLEVDVHNDRAMQFYERNGFSVLQNNGRSAILSKDI